MNHLITMLLLGFILFFFEGITGFCLVPLTKNWDFYKKIELRTKFFELILTGYITLSGVVYLVLFVILRQSHPDYLYYFAMQNGELMMGYFLYHIVSMQYVPSKKIMIIHHLLMITLCYIGLTDPSFNLYMMLAAIPSGSAFVRSWQWVSNASSQKIRSISLDRERAFYLLFQLTPILLVFYHFIFILDKSHIPASLLCIASFIGLSAASIAIYLIKTQILSLVFMLRNKLGRR